ncbi:hypothetical protein H0B56_00420 [Haloechinothrix sp. YIM 98757]|uniref:PE-PGRS family protein n=1 Tax=Haloechinothrix aidingensis TaxID=2752311 RepID=A0A837ZV88_9PSEU|nr:hypothetical protein [Haloechinothrix aidingensis]MBA0124004.1 hypothetical protein [Haloechinothrix aidingensis]
MQNWAKRGFQTALVTGGLLMLGTGIASADENVDPDKSPASPLDGSISVPIQSENNAVGVLGQDQQDLPEFNEEISTKDVTEPVTDGLSDAGATSRSEESGVGSAPVPTGQVTDGAPAEIAKPLTEATKHVEEATAPVTGQAGAAAPRCDASGRQGCDDGGSDGPLTGNQIAADLVVPIQFSNNAIGILGDAHVEGGDSSQSTDNSHEIHTSGTGDTLAGNVIDLDWAAPIQVANNAGAIGGDASSTNNNADQDTTTGGDVTTDGSDGVLSGNVLAGHWATPLQFNNNAAAGGGSAEADGSSSDSQTQSGGSIATDGADGVGSGNVGAGPLATPLALNNSAGSWIGKADSHNQENSVSATGGGTRPGMNDIDTYTQTNGDDSVLSGNIVEPEGAGNGTGHGIAGTWIGTAAAGTEGTNSNETDTKAGAFSNTSGDESVGGGNMVDAPVALPVEAFGVGGSWIGDAEADAENSNSADAGSGTYTSGVDSFLGGNSAHAPLAGAIEAFGIGGSWIGSGEGTATEDKNVEAGGYNGTRGEDSVGGGNVVQTPVAAPVETFGVGGSWIGSGEGSAEETKVVSSGGDGSTIDDDAVAGSNIIAAPVALPAQGFGLGGAWIGNGHGEAEGDTTTTAGGNYEASGDGSTLSANIVQAAVSGPVQAFGIGGVWGGNASGDATNVSETAAGGDTSTTGANSNGSGNIANGALALPLQGHGNGASWIGNASGTSDSVTTSDAGGSSATDGTDSSFGGNVISAPFGGSGALFGNAASWIGTAEGDGMNDVISNAGGDTDTAGDSGSVAGNVLSAQGLPIAQGFGNAGSLTATATGTGFNYTESSSGGDITTSGEEGSLSGNIFDVPAAAVAQVFGNAATLGGVSHGTGDNTTIGTVGGTNTTAGDQGSLSGTDNQLPLGALVQVFNFSLPAFGEAVGVGTNTTDINLAGDVPQIDLVFDGAEMGAAELPRMDGAEMGRSGGPAGAAVPMPLEVPGFGPGQLSPMLQPQAIDGLPTSRARDLDAAPATAGQDLTAVPSADAVAAEDVASGLEADQVDFLAPSQGDLSGLEVMTDSGPAMVTESPAVPAQERSDVPAAPAAPALPSDAELFDLDVDEGNFGELDTIFQDVLGSSQQHPIHMEG